MDVNRLREYMRKWAEYTYRQGINFCRNNTSEEKEMCLEILKKQKMAEKKMDGHSIEGIPDRWEYSLREISLSGLFNDAIESDYLTPASYAVSIVKECIHCGFNFDKSKGVVGRGLRSFPAFLREMDLASKLTGTLEGCECRRANPDEDINGHTDVIINYKGEIINAWSYQNSPRGLNNAADKFSGRRGTLPPGKYILCPIDYRDRTQYEDINGWRLYNFEYVKKIGYQIKESEQNGYFDLLKKSETDLKKFMCKIQMLEKS